MGEIRVEKTAEGYIATVSAPLGGSERWTSPHPMPGKDLIAALAELGCHSTDIKDAFDAAGLEWPGGA